MLKVRTFELTIALFMGKRFRQPDRHSRVSGNPEAPQKLSASARRHVPTKDVRSEGGVEHAGEGWYAIPVNINISLRPVGIGG